MTLSVLTTRLFLFLPHTCQKEDEKSLSAGCRASDRDRTYDLVCSDQMISNKTHVIFSLWTDSAAGS